MFTRLPVQAHYIKNYTLWGFVVSAIVVYYLSIMKTSLNIQNELNTIVQLLIPLGNIEIIYLYGSYATGNATNQSDIDIAVVMTKSHGINMLLEESRLNEELNYKSNIPVHVSILNNKSPLFRFQVISPRHVLFSKNENFRVDFEVKAFNEYFDIKKYLDENYQVAINLAKTNDR